MQSVLVDRESLNLLLDRNFRFSTFNLTLKLLRQNFQRSLSLDAALKSLHVLRRELLKSYVFQ